MLVLNTIQPLTTLLLLTVSVLLIFLGKEIKKPALPALVLIAFLVLVVIHAVQLSMPNYEEFYTTIRSCMAFELTMILVAFLSYLWIDDVASKFYKKKSVDNSLDWFWKQI